MPIGIGRAGLKDYRAQSEQSLQGAMRARGMRQPEIEGPGRTAGGAIMNAGGGAMAGASLAMSLGAAGPPGAAIGAGIGLFSYLLS